MSDDVTETEAVEVATSTGLLVPHPQVTLVEGSSFCVSAHDGEIAAHGSQGLFVRDTRVISRWEVHVDGHRVEPLTVIPREPFDCQFIGRAAPRPGHDDATLIVERHRLVGQGMREDITLRNYGSEAAGVDLAISVDADFADLFQVKDQRVRTGRAVRKRAVGSDLVFWLEHSPDQRGVRVTASGARATSDGLAFRVVVPAHGEWSATVEVLPSVSGHELEAAFPTDRPVESARPARRMRGWNASAPDIHVDNPTLDTALTLSRRDLGALRISDADHPDDDVVAAGAPWFMALFGRDSLLTSAMMLPFFPELALGTLRTLARLQGKRVDVMSEEQPGRILHELRLGADLSLALGGESVYYGSIDSTPLFVVLVGQGLRWGMPVEALQELRPAVDRALAWIDEYGDRDGDGFVEYQRSTDRGLLHQGWKDSFDAISFRSGRQAHPPIALAEVQGYCYAAYLAKAELDEAFGDPGAAAAYRDRAADLKRRFHEAFWLPGQDFYAVALDADKAQVDSVTSNIGHCLWSGIVADDVAGKVAARLVSPEMFTGFGVRTLASDSGAYNPVSYHNGSVWPHDSALVAAGLARYGFRDEACRVVEGLLEAARAFGGRLPELFCGFSREEKPVPVPYPTSCSPQAWAAAVPFEILRTALGLDADHPGGIFRAARPMPVLGRVRVEGLRLGEHALTIDADADAEHVRVHGLPGRVRSEGDGLARDAAAPR
jgi:glycogen debranching enzyme